MPVEFLSEERRERLGRFSDDPTAEQLACCFHLDDADRALVDRRARERARLEFAVQLGTVRFLGTFLADPTAIPRLVVEYVARQLGIADLSVLKGYGDGETRWDHAAEIRRAYGYQDFGDEAVQRRLREWLEARAWTMGERPGVLFDLAVALLLEHKVLLPGPTVLERFVASVHDQAADLWSTLASAPAPAARRALEGLLVVPPGARRSGFDRLRQGPRAPSAAGVTAALQRLEEVRALGLGGVELAGVRQGRFEALAGFTAKARAQAIERMAPRVEGAVAAGLGSSPGNPVQDAKGGTTSSKPQSCGSCTADTGAFGPRWSMRYMVLSVVVVVPLLFAAILMRRDRLRRARLDRRGLDDLRRIYRRDNPRGPGLEPVMRDQQPRVRPEGRAKR